MCVAGLRGAGAAARPVAQQKEEQQQHPSEHQAGAADAAGAPATLMSPTSPDFQQ